MCWKTIRSGYTALVSMKLQSHLHCHYSIAVAHFVTLGILVWTQNIARAKFCLEASAHSVTQAWADLTICKALEQKFTGCRSRNQGGNGMCPSCPIQHYGMVSWRNYIISQWK
jgi:hypothetical protein